jgi:subtilase family serine protease
MKKFKFISLLTSVCLSLSVAVCASGSSAVIKSGTVSPLWKMQHYSAAASPTGYSPEQIKTAYGISGSTLGTGENQTIAIIVAYGDPNLATDIATFNKTYGLADADITISDRGVTDTDPNWALETALDVEWAHAMAPDAKLLVVEAASDSSTDLLNAVDYAVDSGAQIVTMSWGSSEDYSQIYSDSHFTDSDTIFLAASGDDGAGAVWPASSPNVIAVGGTTLSLNSSGSISSETAWLGSGGGASSYESAPEWQRNFGVMSVTRAAPDVSFDADPKTGVSVYCSVDVDGESGWYQMGGTSLGAPAWGGIIADLNEDVTYIKNAGSFYILAGSTGYTNTGDCFNDITEGSNGLFRASAGYDAVTGLGSPQGDNLATQALANADTLTSDTTTATTDDTPTVNKHRRSPVGGGGFDFGPIGW